MSGFEPGLAYQWLFSTLRNDTTLSSLAPGGIWRNLAKAGTATPYILIAYQAGNDVITVNAYRIIVDMTFQVKAVGEATKTDQIVQAAKRIDDLLGGPTAGSIAGGLVLSCNRQAPLFLDEVVDNLLWSSIGGLHRIIVEQTP